MYKLHSLQHPDWHRTGTSYCYFYIFEIIHHHSGVFIFVFLKIKKIFRISPSPFSQRESFFENLPVLPYP